MKDHLFCLLLLLAFLPNLYAQPTPTLQDLNFMAGRWLTTTDWGDQEEIWTAPQGNCITCVYRCVKDGKVVFYEFITIEQAPDGAPVMYLRHFGPGSIAMEDKEEPLWLSLVSVRKNYAEFARPDETILIYERTGRKTLRATLKRKEDGVWKEDVFEYKLFNL